MKSSFIIGLSLLICVGCQSTKRAALLTRPAELAGSYYRGDHKGYNLYLDLQADGTYTAKWRGCLGVYGTARGTWGFYDRRLFFTPSEETDMMKGHLRELHIVQHQGETVFVPDLRDDIYRKYGPTRYAAFHRQQKP